MTLRTSSRLLLLIALVNLLIFAVSPLAAQEPLSQTIDFAADGLTLTVAYPQSWVATTAGPNLFLASSQAALDTLNSGGALQDAGDVGMVFYLPSFLKNLELPPNASADLVVTTYLKSGKIAGSVQASSDYNVPAATAVVTPPNPSGAKVATLIGALELANGTVIFGVVPAAKVDDTVRAIINGIILTSDQSSPQATEQTGAAPTVFDISQSNGSFQLSISLPDGWVNEYDTQIGQLALANSQSALDKLMATGPLVLAAGEVGIEIILPSALPGLGLTMTSAPTDVLTTFKTQTKVTGDIQTDTSFSVPAASAVVTGGNLPEGGTAVYALAFDGGTVFLGVVPASADDDAMQAVLHSIQFNPVAAVPSIPEVQPTPASTESISPNATTFNTTQPNGTFQLSMILPDGWLTHYDETAGQLFLANSQAALDKVMHSTDPMAKGEIGITVAMPNAISALGLSPTSAPTDILTGFETLSRTTGQVQTNTSFSVPAASAVISGAILQQGDVAVYVLAFDGGTIFTGVLPASAADDATLAILQSMRFTQVGEAAATAEPQPTQSSTDSLPLTPTTFAEEQPSGTVQVSFGMPDGWVDQHDNSGFIYIGNSQAAITNITYARGDVNPGQIGISLLLPDQLPRVQITHTDSPSAVITDFEKTVQAHGDIQIDSSFSVPAAYAVLSGLKLPKGGTVVYVFSFDIGMLLVVVQPESEAVDPTIVSILQSIRLEYAPQPAATVTVEPQPTEAPTAVATAVSQAEVVRQWAASADGSTEYGTDSWSFAQATGKPDTTTCDDNGTAWASATSTGTDTLRLTFTHPVIPSQINVYQTYNSGSITEIEVGSSASPDQLTPLPASADNSGTTACPGVFSVDVSGITTPIDYVVIHLDQSIIGSWDEIDAVQLVGTAP